ncbi:hypothetical protein DITRI_Ditri02bG0199800 [Diplodiscus trichospermus]
MASLKAEKPVGTQSSGQGQLKKEPTKPSSSAPKAPASSKPSPKKADQKPREPRKKHHHLIYPLICHGFGRHREGSRQLSEISNRRR